MSSEPDTERPQGEPPDTERPGPEPEPPENMPPVSTDDRRVAVETGGMESDPVGDLPPHATPRDVVTGGMRSDPHDEPDRAGLTRPAD
jgi:hypothetical protein